MPRVQLLVPPLDPAGLRARTVDQAQSDDLVRVQERVPREDVGAGADAESYDVLQPEVRQHELNLRGQLVHRREDIPERR